jgi:hypothetical protein
VPDALGEALALITATRQLDAAAVSIGTIGDVRLFARAKRAKLARSAVRHTLLAAVCLKGRCTVKPSATLRLVPKRGKATTRTVRFTKLTLKRGKGGKLVLRTTAAQRAAIRAAKRASLTLKVRSGGKSLSRTFAFGSAR